MLVGNSQETRIWVGRVRVSTGIAPHVFWEARASPASRDTSRRHTHRSNAPGAVPRRGPP
jgi:hypothetical protein